MLPHLALALGIAHYLPWRAEKRGPEDAISAKGHNKKINLPGAPTIAANPASTLSAAAHNRRRAPLPKQTWPGPRLSGPATPARWRRGRREAFPLRAPRWLPDLASNSRAVLPGLAAVGSGERSAATARPRLAQTAAMPDAGAMVAAKRPGALLERSALGAESGQNRPGASGCRNPGEMTISFGANAPNIGFGALLVASGGL